MFRFFKKKGPPGADESARNTSGDAEKAPERPDGGQRPSVGAQGDALRGGAGPQPVLKPALDAGKPAGGSAGASADPAVSEDGGAKPATGAAKPAGPEKTAGPAEPASPEKPAGPKEPASSEKPAEPPEASATARGDVAGEREIPPADAPSLASAAAPAPEKSSWLSRLRRGLSRTGKNIGGLFTGGKVDESLFEELETALIMADAGVEATESLLTALRARVRKERLADAGQVRSALCDILADHLAPLEKPFPLGSVAPLVVMIAGVNGAGKTTSIGKLANAFQRQGASVLLAAGDTFRAAAREQLMAWGARNNVTVIAQDGGDPAAVAFDAVNAGRARQAGVVMIDTAGRLPTQLHLMEELKKIRRVIGKADSAAPHEVLLVIDGNTGQNAISQIRAFDAAVNLTGLVVTKLDGTAKGGTLAAVAAGSQGVRPVPVYWIGVGEGLDDLQPFVAREFAAALVGGE